MDWQSTQHGHSGATPLCNASVFGSKVLLVQIMFNWDQHAETNGVGLKREIPCTEEEFPIGPGRAHGLFDIPRMPRFSRVCYLALCSVAHGLAESMHAACVGFLSAIPQ